MKSLTQGQLKCCSPATLKKYGLSRELWYTVLDLQDGLCPVCGEPFTEERRPVIDHEHVKGYKKMPPEKKVTFVRGMLHLYCNYRMIPKGMTTEKAYNVYQYLSDYDLRRNDNDSINQ